MRNKMKHLCLLILLLHFGTIAIAQLKVNKTTCTFLVEWRRDSVCPSFASTYFQLGRNPVMVKYGTKIDTSLYSAGVFDFLLGYLKTAAFDSINKYHNKISIGLLDYEHDTIFQNAESIYVPFTCTFKDYLKWDDKLTYKKVKLEIEYFFIGYVDIEVPLFNGGSETVIIRCPCYSVVDYKIKKRKLLW